MGDKSPKAKAKSKKREEALEALTKADDERTARPPVTGVSKT